MDAAVPSATVRTSGSTRFITSQMTIPASIEPPGLWMNRVMSSGERREASMSCTVIHRAASSSIGPARKKMRSPASLASVPIVCSEPLL